MSDKKKFFFDLHNFNDDAEEEEGPPPPPTFSEEELAEAKKAAYEKGKQDGYNESQQSIEKNIAVLLENAKAVFLDLQTAEQAREKVYEEEAVHLAIDLFQNIFPAWVEEKGPKEVENAVLSVLQQAANQQNIKIEVAPALLESIEKRLEPIKNQLSEISISIHANEALSNNDMRMKWDNGGAIRDSKKLAAQILQGLTNDVPQKALNNADNIEEDLADIAETRHNNEIKTETSDE